MSPDAMQRPEGFLVPESMLTPGIAGGMVMLITNTLATNLGFPRALTGLVLSFVIGLLIFATAKIWWQRGVYYVLNSLVIFCTAVGVNGVGGAVSPAAGISLFAVVGPAIAEPLSKEQLELDVAALTARRAQLTSDVSALADESSDLSARLKSAQEQGADQEKLELLTKKLAESNTTWSSLLLEIQSIDEEIQAKRNLQESLEKHDVAEQATQRTFFSPWFGNLQAQ